MKYSVYKHNKNGSGKLTNDINQANGHWVRFGNELFAYSANAKWGSVEQNLSSGRSQKSSPTGTVRKNDLYLVRQKGRVFQLDNPKVPVLFDKGRYLIVELTPAKAKKFKKQAEPCFDIQALDEDSVVFNDAEVEKFRSAPEQTIATMVDQLTQARYLAVMTQLVSFTTRYSVSEDYKRCAHWAADEFSAMGLASQVQSISVGTQGESFNVIATLPGQSTDEREHIIVTAHLDSVNHPGGINAPAPGADDNASGSAGVLELANVLASEQYMHDITFILFGGEEQGLHGSKQYLALMPEDERARVNAVLNMDMIGSVNTPQQTVLLEGAALSQQQIDDLTAAAATYTSLQVQTSLNPFASDHVPFIEAGISAVLTIEGADSANDSIHTSADTLEKISPQYALEILKMNLAFIARRAGLIGTSQSDDDCGCSGAQGETELTAELRQFENHCQQLFAQYVRLHRQGGLQAQHYAEWQSLEQLRAFILNQANQ